MRDWIAAVMMVLGTLMVLGGAAVIAVRALAPVGAPQAALPDQPTGEIPVAPVGPSSRILGAVRRIQAADRLIAWGVLLLILAAVAAGAISFNLGANAGTR